MWYVVETYEGRERAVQSDLDDLGIHAYIPSYTERTPHRRYAGVMLTQTVDLFPGYLFVQDAPSYLGRSICLDPVYRVRHVLGILGDEGMPIPVPAYEIEAVRRYCRAMSSTDAGDRKATSVDWGIGDLARLAVGGWNGLVEIVERRGRNRLVVKSQELGAIPVLVSSGVLEAAE